MYEQDSCESRSAIKFGLRVDLTSQSKVLYPPSAHLPSIWMDWIKSTNGGTGFIYEAVGKCALDTTLHDFRLDQFN